MLELRPLIEEEEDYDSFILKDKEIEQAKSPRKFSENAFMDRWFG